MPGPVWDVPGPGPGKGAKPRIQNVQRIARMMGAARAILKMAPPTLRGLRLDRMRPDL